MTQLSPFANHLWQSTLFAGFIALVTLALRQNRAQLRHALWLAASVKFLVPFSLLVSAGSRVEWRSAQTAIPAALTSVGQQFTAPFAAALPAPVSIPSPQPVLPVLLAGLWLAGCAAVLVRWWRRSRRVAAAIGDASRLPIIAPVAVMTSPSLLEPGVFGVFRPVILLPDGIADRLTPGQVQTILVHELCHVRRRDNLASSLHMVVEALCWFHPLVWWIGARLVEERERACDEEVLRLGGEPEVYAAGIINVCRLYVESPLPCVSGVTGAGLEKRIEQIMTHRLLSRLTFTRKVLLAAASFAAIALPIAMGIVNAPGLRAQVASNLRFEVASIKPVKGDVGKGFMQTLPGGGLRMGNVTLKGLIGMAYGMREDQISGGPAWISSQGYELIAKPENPEAADMAKSAAPGSEAWRRMSQRLQNLLAERFRLVIHTNGKEQSGYTLVQAKGGTKLKPSEHPDVPAGTMRSRGRIDGRAGTMTMLATVLSNMLGSPVADRTELTGVYDYKLEYAQDSGPGGKFDPGDEPAPDSGHPSIFVALQEQLGLKLESTKVAVQSIVVDSAERPSN